MQYHMMIVFLLFYQNLSFEPILTPEHALFWGRAFSQFWSRLAMYLSILFTSFFQTIYLDRLVSNHFLLTRTKPTLQTRLDLYNSELALASSPVLFWNLCVQLEIWISIVICGLAAVVSQASIAPLPPFSFSYLFLRDSCQLRKSSLSTSLTPSPAPSQYPTLDYGNKFKEIMYCTLYVQS